MTVVPWLAGVAGPIVCAAMMIGCLVGVHHVSTRRPSRRHAAGAPAETTAAVIFADLDGYTALTEREGDQRAAEVAARLGHHAHSACVGTARVVKVVGDAVMLRAADADDAAFTALRLISELAADDLMPLAAIGVSSGPCVQRRGDLFGVTVNVAARIADAARPGEIWCTATVAGAAAGLGLVTNFLDEVRLEGVAEPVPLFRLGGASVAEQRLDPAAALGVAR